MSITGLDPCFSMSNSDTRFNVLLLNLSPMRSTTKLFGSIVAIGISTAIVYRRLGSYADTAPTDQKSD